MKKKIISAVIAGCMLLGSAACLPQNAFTTGTSITATAETATEITSGNFVYDVYSTYAVLKKYNGSAANLKIPASYQSIPVTQIGFQCFYQNTKLESVTFPSTITNIGGAAFSGCSNLKELVDFRNTKVTYLGLGAFANCKMLDMDYNDFPSTIQTIEGSAFNNCAKLRSIDVSNLRSLGTYAFEDCTSLTAVYGFQNCSVREIPEEAFYNSGLRGNVVMPSVEKVGKNAFYGCESITNLHLPKAAVLGESCFEECTSLKSITLSEDIAVLPNFAFYNCKSLGADGGFSIPAKVTKIGEKCFYGCLNFTYIVVPSLVKEIGSYALGIKKNGGYNQRIVNTIYCYPQSQQVTEKYVDDTGLWQKAETITCVHTYNGVTTTPPTCTKKGVMTYTCSKCMLSYTSDIAALGHDYSKITRISEPTCTKKGVEKHACSRCSASYNVDIEPTGHNFKGVKRKVVTYSTPAHEGQYKLYCSECGGSEEGGIQDGTTNKTNSRLFGTSRYETGIAVADQLKAENGGKAFEKIIVCDGRGFADALSASYLASVLDAPILLVANGKDTAVIDYIKNNSTKGAAVYVIGGEAAVSPDIYNKIKAVRSSTERVAGANRYETSQKVVILGAMWAQVLNKSIGTDLIIADGNNFADALSASATGQPILLVNGKAGKALTEEQKSIVKAYADEKLGVIIAGGTGAVNAALEADIATVKKPTRLAGDNRYQTSVRIAEYFFKSPAALTIATGAAFPDGLCGGPLGRKTNCPLILTAKSKGADANAYAKSKKATTAWILGGTAVVSDADVSEIIK